MADFWCDCQALTVGRWKYNNVKRVPMIVNLTQKMRSKLRGHEISICSASGRLVSPIGGFLVYNLAEFFKRFFISFLANI